MIAARADTKPSPLPPPLSSSHTPPHAFSLPRPPHPRPYPRPARCIMPSEHPVPQIYDQQPSDQSQGQVKLCSACHCPLSADSPNTAFFLHGDSDSSETTIVCRPCYTRLDPLRAEAPPTTIEYFNMERELMRRAASLQGGRNEAPAAPRRELLLPAVHPQVDRRLDVDEDMDRPSSSTPSLPHVEPPSSVPTLLETPVVHVPSRPTPTPIDTTLAPPQARRPSLTAQRSPVQLATPSSSRSRPPAALTASPDPLSDITRLRVRSQGHHCLYPGATFQGTQKSGRNSYDVNVTIVVSTIMQTSRVGQLELIQSCIGCRLLVLSSVRLSAHTRLDRRLARAHHVLRCRDHRESVWVLDAQLGSDGAGRYGPLGSLPRFPTCQT